VYRLEPKIVTAFHERGLRCTPQRYAVLDYVMRHPVHATAEEVYHAVNRTDPRASRATVYNNLHALVEAGLVREVRLEGRSARFDANTGRHHHFVCERCGRVEDICWFDVPRLARRSQLGSRVVREYEMVFRGTCEICSSDSIKQ
jgi:Fe2+ or Zn2+ uptake regulation protein